MPPSTSDRRGALLAATAAVAVLGGLTVASVRAHSPHPGEHFLDGQADPGAVTVAPDPTRVCGYDTDSGTAHVPVHLKVARHASEQASSQGSEIVGAGWVTLHVTASVSQGRAGRTVVASAAQDFVMNVGVGSSDWVDVPLDRSPTRLRSTDCTITTWTMTPGAWLPDDD